MRPSGAYENAVISSSMDCRGLSRFWALADGREQHKAAMQNNEQIGIKEQAWIRTREGFMGAVAVQYTDCSKVAARGCTP